MDKKRIENEELLEAAVGGVGTVTTNGPEASESPIEDAEKAKEMVAYTTNLALQQAAQAMMAQANPNAETVLRLDQ